MDLSTGLSHYFSCNASGDMIQFVMLRDQANFVESCKNLGVWRSSDPAEAKAWRRAREVKQAAERAKDDAYVKAVEELLKEMEREESILRAAEAAGDAERAAIAQGQIDHIGGRFLLLKMEHEYGPPAPEEAAGNVSLDKLITTKTPEKPDVKMTKYGLAGLFGPTEDDKEL